VPISSILKDTPSPLAEARPDLPADVDRMPRQCLWPRIRPAATRRLSICGTTWKTCKQILCVSRGCEFCLLDTDAKATRLIYSAHRDTVGPPRLSRDGRAA